MFVVLQYIFALNAADLAELWHGGEFQRITASSVELTGGMEIAVIFQKKMARGEDIVGNIFSRWVPHGLLFKRFAGKTAFGEPFLRNRTVTVCPRSVEMHDDAFAQFIHAMTCVRAFAVFKSPERVEVVAVQTRDSRGGQGRCCRWRR